MAISSPPEHPVDSPTGAAGRAIGGRYTLVAPIGTGGMGTVWRGFDKKFRRPVAVKEVLIHDGLPAPEREVLCERTLREARAAAALDHSAVIQIFDVVQDNDRPWIIMELLAARSLADIIKEDGRLPVNRVAEIGLAVLAALEVAHKAEVLHRDVKPGNVLVCDDGRIVLADFGVARSPNETSLTSTGLLLGSPQYIAPERARGRSFGPPSDLFSLGATLYAAVEGRPPFDRGEPLPTMTAVVCELPDPMEHAGPLAPVLHGLLEKEPDNRWDTERTRAALRSVVIAHRVRPFALVGTGSGGSGTGGRVSAGRHRRIGEPKILSALARPIMSAAEATAAIVTSRVRAHALAAATRRLTPPKQRTAVEYGAPIAKPLLPRPAPASGPVAPGRDTRAIAQTRTTAARPPAGRGSKRRRAMVLWLICGVLVLIMLGVAGLVINHALTPPPGSSSTHFQRRGAEVAWRNYRDQAGYQLKVPRSWKEERVKPEWIQFNAPDDETSLRIYVEAGMPPSLTATQKMRGAERRQQSLNNEYQRIRLRSFAMREYDAALWEWHYRGGDGRVRHVRTIAVIEGGVSYEISLSAHVHEFDKYRAIHTEIAESLRITV